MVETFTPPRAPTHGADLTPDVLSDEMQFGDGYRVRARQGINSISDVWSLTWPALTASDFAEIWDFLRPKLHVTAFYWTPPGESTAQLWTVRDLKMQRVTGSLRRIDAKFREEFDQL